MWFVAATSLAAAPSHAANVSVPIALRVASFMIPAPAAGSTVILFLPGNAVSEGEAGKIEQDLAASGIKGRRIPVTALANMTGARMAFVTGGLRTYHDEIAAVAARQRTLTVTGDGACVSAGRCAVGVNTAPGAQIVVSRAACRTGNIRFGSAFLMLVKEI